MFDIISINDAAPTRLLRTALEGWKPDIDGPTYADLVIYPVRDSIRNADRWYDVYYTHKAVEDTPEFEPGGEIRVVHRQIAKAATLPAPPRIPVEERLAALPEPTLDGWTEDKIRFCGGPDEALELVRRRQEAAVRDDQTVETWDWAAAAEQYKPILDAIAPRKLTADQRVHVGQARVWEAEEELASARASLEALEANANRATAKA